MPLGHTVLVGHLEPTGSRAYGCHRSTWGNLVLASCGKNSLLSSLPAIYGPISLRIKGSFSTAIMSPWSVSSTRNGLVSQGPWICCALSPCFPLRYNIYFKARHIPGKQNEVADSLSRFQMDRFRALAPLADANPTPIPSALWEL